MLKTALLCLKKLSLRHFLSRMSRESQHTRFEDQILGQVSLWGRPASCASLPSTHPPAPRLAFGINWKKTRLNVQKMKRKRQKLAYSQNKLKNNEEKIDGSGTVSNVLVNFWESSIGWKRRRFSIEKSNFIRLHIWISCHVISPKITRHRRLLEQQNFNKLKNLISNLFLFWIIEILRQMFGVWNLYRLEIATSTLLSGAPPVMEELEMPIYNSIKPFVRHQLAFNCLVQHQLVFNYFVQHQLVFNYFFNINQFSIILFNIN